MSFVALLLSVFLALGLCQSDNVLSSSTSASTFRVQPGHVVELSFFIPYSTFPTQELADSVVGLNWRVKGQFLPTESDIAMKIGPISATQGTEGLSFHGYWYAPPRECKQHLELLVVDATGPLLVDNQRLVFERVVIVTCSNGIYCDGQERFVKGKCVPGNANLCDDGEACTIDTCTEEHGGHCVWTLNTTDDTCKTCGETKCIRNCAGLQCGDDGCSGVCGICDTGFVCNSGTCEPTSTGVREGTCSSPIPLLLDGDVFLGTHSIAGDTSGAVNLLSPTCNYLSDAPELIYSFTVPTGAYQYVGAVFTLTGNYGYEYDTVLEVYEGACGTKQGSIGCADDSAPPGSYGSRLDVKLKPGSTYYVHVDGYSALYSGPFLLDVVFFADCAPQCDGNYCLDNGCGQPCDGGCAAGEFCSQVTARCVVDGCVPDCDGKECGPDGCEGICGVCGGGTYCSFDITADGEAMNLGQCLEPEKPCDNNNPVCAGGCGTTHYCGTDCQCHRPEEAVADLVAEIGDIVMDYKQILETSCSHIEVRSTNYGWKDLIAPAPKELPQFFQWGECHGHWHFSGFARYALFDANDQVVANAGKEAYCLEDSGAIVEAPWVECSSWFDCGYQGVQRGWTDEYSNVLDCQWLDVTGVPDGIYRLEVTVNNNMRMHEYTYDNNVAYAFVQIAGDVLTEVSGFPDVPAAPEPDSSACLIPSFFLVTILSVFY